MSKHVSRFHVSLVLFAGLVLTLAVLISCGGTTSSPPSQVSTTGTVTTSIGDPPTCSLSTSQVWVTITKVTAHINGDAGPSDSGWQTLVDLTSGPKQIDLMSLAQSGPSCLLKILGSTTGLPPGNYQQIRVYLLANDATGITISSDGGTNQCGTSNSAGPFNCVVPQGGSAETLLLSSEAQTGIKIPPGQIGGGGINLQVSQSADISINFMACESIVRQGNGQFRLKPTLHANEVSLNTNTLSGRVVDANTHTPIPNAVVLLEQASQNCVSNPCPAIVPGGQIDDVKEAGVTDVGGNFFFCPLGQGQQFDVVIAATTMNQGVPTTYNATVTRVVPVGTNLGDVGLVPESTTVGMSTVPSSPATITGQITTTSGSASPFAAGQETAGVVTLTALQTTGGSSPVFVIVPIFDVGTALTVTTVSGTTNAPCPTGTDCVNYTLNVPGSNPQVGTYSSSGTNYTPPAANPAVYWVWAQGFDPTTPTSSDCNPSSQPATFDTSTQITVTPGSNPAHDISFASCTAGR